MGQGPPPEPQPSKLQHRHMRAKQPAEHHPRTQRGVQDAGIPSKNSSPPLALDFQKRQTISLWQGRLTQYRQMADLSRQRTYILMEI